MERDLKSLKCRTTEDLNKILAGALLDIRRGDVGLEKAKGMIGIANVMNKNNVNQLEYKRLTKHDRLLIFFEEADKESDSDV